MRISPHLAVLATGYLTPLLAHGHSNPSSVESAHILQQKWGTDWPFSGISTFARMSHVKCPTQPDEAFDIGIIGAPFNTAVSYSPGARFRPRAIRASSSCHISFRSFNYRAGINPYTSWAKIEDCGDIPISPFDNNLALPQMSD